MNLDAVSSGSHILSRRRARTVEDNERSDSEGERMVRVGMVGGDGMSVGEERVIGGDTK